MAVWLDEAIDFSTGPGEEKAVNLADNPHVVRTTGCNHCDRGADIVVESAAVKVTDDGKLRWLADAWRREWDGRWQYKVGDGGFEREQGFPRTPSWCSSCRSPSWETSVRRIEMPAPPAAGSARAAT